MATQKREGAARRRRNARGGKDSEGRVRGEGSSMQDQFEEGTPTKVARVGERPRWTLRRGRDQPGGGGLPGGGGNRENEINDVIKGFTKEHEKGKDPRVMGGRKEPGEGGDPRGGRGGSGKRGDKGGEESQVDATEVRDQRRRGRSRGRGRGEEARRE